MKLEEKLSPEQRIREYNDIANQIDRICGILKWNDTVDDIELSLPENEKITMTRHHGIVVGVYEKEQKQTILTSGQVKKVLQEGYLLTNGGLELLEDAVLSLGRREVFLVGDDKKIEMIPKDGELLVKWEG